MSVLLKSQIPVHVIVITGLNPAERSSLKWIKNQIKQIEKGHQGQRIRMYSSDRCTALNLAQNGIQAPWGLLLISDGTDSNLFAMANKIFYKLVNISSQYKDCFYKGVSLTAMLHDDYIRKFRDQLLVEALCKEDQTSEDYGAHILFTAFSHYIQFWDSIVDIIDIRHPAVNGSQRVFSILRVLYLWVISLVNSLSVKLKTLKPKRDSSKISIDSQITSNSKILFVVTEPIGGKNCLDPLISMIRAINKSFSCDYHILVDNKYSVNYLNKHNIESQLIIKSEGSDYKDKVYTANKLMKKIALKLTNMHKNSIETLLYLTFVFSNTLNNLEDLFYRIKFCDSFIENYRPDVVMVYPDEAYSGFATAQICRKRKIPTMTFFQSIISNHELYNNRHTDKVAIYGTQGREALLNLGFPEDYSVLTGNPKLDSIPIRSKEDDMNYIRNLLPNWDNRPLLVLATHLLVSKSELSIAYFFSSLANEGLKIFYPVVKLHPDDDFEPYQKLLSEYLPGYKVPLLKNCDLYALLNCSDVVVTSSSTVGAEAALFDKPLMTMNFSGKPFSVRYADEGIAIEVTKKEDVFPTLKRILYEPDTIQYLAKGRKKFIERYAYKLDGKSGERVIQTLLDLAKKPK